MFTWTSLVPLLSIALVGLGLAWPVGPLLASVAGLALIASVLASVHHAEVVAHRVGEPFGTLILAIAITVIEVALIFSVMLAGGENNATLARDTIFASLMIICNGLVGCCLLAGGIKHHVQVFRIEGAHSAFAALITLATLSLVLPGFTLSAPGPYYTAAQLAFVAIASLVIWAVFVFVQTVRHRDYFLPVDAAPDEDAHAPLPSNAVAWMSFGLLLVALVVVVGLAKVLSPTIERGVAAAGAPASTIGVAIAMLVLLPETWAAIRAALANRLQTSMNLAFGSALASIGLTIPVVAFASVWLDIRLVLGITPKDMVLLVLTFMVGTITIVSGRTTVMQGTVHLVIFATFLILALIP